MENNWFRFSDEQWKRLRQILKKYEKTNGLGFGNNINRFIIEVEACCKVFPYLATGQALADHRDRLYIIEKSLKSVAKELKFMCSKGFNVILQTHIRDTEGRNMAKFLEKSSECSNAVYSAYIPLMRVLRIIQGFRKTLDAEKPRRGRPHTDPQGIVTEMARIFAEHIGKPTTYEGGPFAEVVRPVLESVNLPAQDPGRSIKKAIREISSKQAA